MNQINSKKEQLKFPYIIMFSPVLLALILTPITNINLTPDSLFYLEHALNIYNGEGYNHLDRGPVYPYLLSIGFFLTGPDVFGAMIIMRFFFLASIILVMALTKQLMNNTAAFIAGILIITASYFNTAFSTVSIDGIYSFFVLLGIFSCVRSLDRESTAWSIIAGISFGLSVLTKELGFLHLFFPIILLLTISQYRNSNKIRKLVLIQQSVAILTILPWFIYIYANSNDFSTILGSGNRALDRLSDSNDQNVTGLFTAIQYYLSGLVTFFERNIKILILWPLFILGWLILFYDSIKDTRSRIILIFLVLFLPAIFAQGYMFIRTGQNYLFYTGTLIYVAYILQKLTVYFFKNHTAQIFSVIVFALLTGTSQILYDKKPIFKMWDKNSIVIRMFTGNNTDWQVNGIINKISNKTAQWIDDNVEPGESILAGYTLFRSLNFETGGEYNVDRIPYYTIVFTPFTNPPKSSIKLGLTSLDGIQSSDYYDNLGQLLYLWNHRRSLKFCRNQKEPCLYLRTLYENEFWEKAKKENVKYLVLEERTWFFHSYFDQHPYAEKVAQISPRVLIYRLTKYEPLNNFRPHFGDEIPILANMLKEQDIEGFHYLENEIFRESFGMNLDSDVVLFPKDPMGLIRTK